jgi:preprotein translocase subunit SecD
MDFRILARRDRTAPALIDASDPEGNEPGEKYLTQFEAHGPETQPGDRCVWIEIAEDSEESFTEAAQYIVATRDHASYVLAADDPELVVLDDGTWALKEVSEGKDRLGRPAIDFTLDERGAEKFSRLTEANIGRPLAVVIDGKALNAAIIQSQILNRGQITGNFTKDRVRKLVSALRKGMTD